MEQPQSQDHDVPSDPAIPVAAPFPRRDEAEPDPVPAPTGGEWRRRVPPRGLLLALAIAALLVAGVRFLSRSLQEVEPGEAGVAVNTFTGRVRVLGPGTHFLPRALVTLHRIRISDQLLAGPDAVVTVSTKDGLAASLALQARWAVDPALLAARWASLPADPARELVAPVLASSFRVAAPAYDALALRAEKREELASTAAARAAERLAGSGIVLKDVAVADVRLPEEYEKGRLAVLAQMQASDQKEALLKIKKQEIEQGRLEAEADKVRKEKAAEADASQKVIAAKGESDAMQYVLPLKEKAIEQQKLEAEADRVRKLREAQADAEAGKISVEAEAAKRRTLADAEAYAIRTTSAAQFENLKREVELVQANPVWVSKTFAEKISDKVQVILTPQLSSNVFTDEVLKRVANGKPAVAAREEAKEETEDAPKGGAVPASAARTAVPTPTPSPENEGTR